MRASRTKRRIGWIASGFAMFGLPFALACNVASPASTPPIEDEDSGVFFPADGAAADSGASRDAAGPGGRTGATESDTDEVACADFLDDADDAAGDGTDCQDPDCGGTRVCCVESTSATCCGIPEGVIAPAIDFGAATCAEGSVAATCVGGVTGFGTASSVLVRNIDEAGSSCTEGSPAMAPQGGATSDGGLLFEQTYDTGSAAVVLEALVGVGSASVGSIDAVAVGLTAQTELGATARVRPIVAIVVSATDQTIRAVAGDVVFDATSLAPLFGSGGCHELDVRITTSPDGTFEASYRRHGDEAWGFLFAAPQYFAPEPLAHPVVYGRTTNPGIEGVHAWVRTVGIASALCDVIAPSRSTETVYSGATSSAGVRSVSRLGAFAAYEIDGTIHAAGVDGNGRIDETAALINPPLLDPSVTPAAFYAAGAFDPELSQVGVNVRLYFTGLSDTGVRSIGYVDFTDDLRARVAGSAPRQLFAPETLGIVDADGPAYIETFERDGTTRRRLLVFRAVVPDFAGSLGTHTEIRALELDGPDAVLGESPELIDSSADASTSGFYSRSSPLNPGVALYRNRADDDTAFDRDEVGQPEIVSYNGVFRIFFAGRRGARWSIGMLRSPDFEHFDLASTSALLTGSGSGFDAVSVSDPDVSVRGERLSIYYSGSNGVETRPGLATQTVPTP